MPADLLALAPLLPGLADVVKPISDFDRIIIVTRGQVRMGPLDCCIIPSALWFVTQTWNQPLRRIVRVSDRYNTSVQHVLFSNHSSLREMVELFDVVRPREFAPIDANLPRDIMSVLHGRYAAAPAAPRPAWPSPPPTVAAFMNVCLPQAEETAQSLPVSATSRPPSAPPLTAPGAAAAAGAAVRVSVPAPPSGERETSLRRSLYALPARFKLEAGLPISHNRKRIGRNNSSLI